MNKNPENGPKLLNKVKKIIKDQFFFIKSKMLRMYGFHINFQFPAHKSLPRDLQMALALPGQSKWSSTYSGASRKSMNGF